MSERATEGAGASGAGNVVTELVDLLFAPSRTFEALRRRGAWAHGTVLAVLALAIVVALRGLLEPFIEANMVLALRQAAARGQAMPAGAAGAMASFAWWGFVGTAAMAVPGAALFGGLGLWLGARPLSVPLSFGRAAVVATLSAIALPVGTLLMAVQGALLDPATVRGITDASLGPARFVDPTTMSPALLAILARLDLPSLWGVVLGGIGVSVMGGVTRGTGFLVAALSWTLATVVGILPTLLL